MQLLPATPDKKKRHQITKQNLQRHENQPSAQHCNFMSQLQSFMIAHAADIFGALSSAKHINAYGIMAPSGTEDP